MKAVTAAGSRSRRATAPVTSAVPGSAPMTRAPDGSAGAAPTGTRRPVAADGRGAVSAVSAAAGTDTAIAPASVSAAISRRPAPNRQGGRGRALAEEFLIRRVLHASPGWQTRTATLSD